MYIVLESKALVVLIIAKCSFIYSYSHYKYKYKQ